MAGHYTYIPILVHSSLYNVGGALRVPPLGGPTPHPPLNPAAPGPYLRKCDIGRGKAHKGGSILHTVGNRYMMGLQGAVLIPILILASATILYFGLLGVRSRQVRRRKDAGEI